MKIPFYVITLCFLISIFHCSKDQDIQAPKANRCYLFLGHIYDWNTYNRVDPRVEMLNLAAYNEIWLGGDLTARTSSEVATVNYLDDLFDLASPNTYWALGNHDTGHGHIERITNTTAGSRIIHITRTALPG